MKRLLTSTVPALLLSLIIGLLLTGLNHAYAEPSGKSAPPPLVIEVLSSKTLNGVAGNYVTVSAQITNAGKEPVTDITTYLSLVDTENKMPVDLEDWSVEKGLYIGTIEPGQTLPLKWKIHFVKAGTYSLIIVAEASTSDIPQVSSITQFTVSPKHNLNPGQVLVVALGTPIVLVFVLLMIRYKRRVD